mgnify:CR=1 FL=1
MNNVLWSNQKIYFGRKFRWVMSGNFNSIKIPDTFIKLSHRLDCDSECVDKSVTATIVDNTNIQTIYNVVNENIGNITPTYVKTENHWIKRNQSKFYGNVDFKLYDGVGNLVETWKLSGVTIHSMSTSNVGLDEPTTKINFRYTNCDYISGHLSFF